MDFYFKKAQRKARLRTFFLVFIFMVLIIASSTIFEFIGTYITFYKHYLVPYLSIAFPVLLTIFLLISTKDLNWFSTVIIFFFALLISVTFQLVYQYDAELSKYIPFWGILFAFITITMAYDNYRKHQKHGGHYIAQAMGGYIASPWDHPRLKLISDLRDEIAASSGIKPPALYILPAEKINAFAAGTASDNYVVALTLGAINKLSEEELAGVIAHEFGHIYNKDVKLNMLLASMVMGFFWIFYLAYSILGSSSSYQLGRKNESILEFILSFFMFITLFTFGLIMWLFGSILKAAVSRQREFLADACAVRFTNKPAGITGALKKIYLETVDDMPRTGQAYSHTYLDNRTKIPFLLRPIYYLFATHPPLKRRIKAIEKRTFIPKEWMN